MNRVQLVTEILNRHNVGTYRGFSKIIACLIYAGLVCWIKHTHGGISYHANRMAHGSRFTSDTLQDVG